MACVRTVRVFGRNDTLLEPSDDRNEGLRLGDTDGDNSFMDSLPIDNLDVVPLYSLRKDIVSPASSRTPAFEPIS
jgi:hypothetical protein